MLAKTPVKSIVSED